MKAITMSSLTKTQKIAIVISQYKTLSHQILPRFTTIQRNEILTEVARCGNVPQKVVDEVLEEFLKFYANNSVSLGGIDVAKDILYSMYDSKEEADAQYAILTANISGAPLQILNKLDIEALKTFVIGMHPQMIATIICHISEPKKQANIISSLDRDIQNKVVEGIATLGVNAPNETMINEIERYVDENFSANISSNNSNNKASIGGIEPLVQIVNNLAMDVEKSVMDNLERANPELSEEIKSKMFVFDDFIKLEDKDIQTVLRDITSDEHLAMCLRFASQNTREELQEKFFKNLSNRKAEIIKDTMSTMDKIKPKDLDEARQSITSVAKKLYDNGEISLESAAEEYIE